MPISKINCTKVPLGRAPLWSLRPGRSRCSQSGPALPTKIADAIINLRALAQVKRNLMKALPVPMFKAPAREANQNFVSNL